MLSDGEFRDVLVGRVLPEATRDAVRQVKPVVVFVAGQPGAGKTLAADLVQAVLGRRGGAVRVCRDLYKSEHPRYADLLAANVRTAGAGVRPDTRRMQAAVEDHVRVGGFDAVVETALADPDEFREDAAAYRRSRHRLELLVVATAEALSQAGVLERFLVEGRYVSWRNHDDCVRGLLATLGVVESEQLVDRVTVVRRDGTVLYDNDLTGGVWRRPPGADRAVAAEWARPWTARETFVFRAELARTDRRLHLEVADEDRRLAVQRDAERAAALAEPVRRIAQPTAGPPGVDYHRLCTEEFEWTWTELIVPGYLADITPHEHPVTTVVLGQPGAGKTRTAHLVRRALRHRRPVTINGEDFKGSHPDYWSLLQTEPRTAGARIRADYTAWQRRAEAYVRDRGGDMVIESAPAGVDRFRAAAEADRAAGRKVDLVVLAVRAADSRQGTAARYARLARTGPARYTTAEGHDACLRALPDVVAAAEAEHLADSVVVMRRDGTAVYRNERAPDGRWRRPARAAAVLLAEQHRPYTDTEAAAFAAVQDWLITAMPHYRDDLRDIMRLATPLLPTRWRPSALVPARSSAALPVPAAAFAASDAGDSYGSLRRAS